jgi:hypothetical protein
MKYSVYSESCQKFTYLLFEAIRQPHEPPTVSDVLSGLDKIPRPFRTLFFRCQAVGIIALISLRARALAAVKYAVWAPLGIVIRYGIWAKNITFSCFILAIFALRVYLHLLFLVFSLAYDRDLQKASQGLWNIVDDVRGFDGYKRPEKDNDKML